MGTLALWVFSVNLYQLENQMDKNSDFLWSTATYSLALIAWAEGCGIGVLLVWIKNSDFLQSTATYKLSSYCFTGLRVMGFGVLL